MGKIKLFGKNLTLWEKSNFLRKIKLFGKNQTFWEKSNFLGKIKLFRKNLTAWEKIKLFKTEKTKLKFGRKNFENTFLAKYPNLQVLFFNSYSSMRHFGYCGSNPGPVHVINSSGLRVDFHSDQTINGNGFKLVWQCGDGTMQFMHGNINITERANIEEVRVVFVKMKTRTFC